MQRHGLDHCPEGFYNMPLCRSPTERRCFFILHFFAGRRRAGDYHYELMSLSSHENFDLRVLSFDTAISPTLGDLSSHSQTWGNITRLLRGGYVTGALAGPPCETFTEARDFLPDDVSEEEKQKWPRRLRDALLPWGLDGLKSREMKQLKVVSAFAIQMLWVCAMLLIQGGHMMIEHPAPPKDQTKVSIFRLPITQLLLKLAEIQLRVVMQKDWGACAVKPTGFLTLRMPKFLRSLYRWKAPNQETTPAIGKSNGVFKTAALKEYPRALAQGLAQGTIDAIKHNLQLGSTRMFTQDEIPNEILTWCGEVENVMTDTSQMLPDFQGAASVY